MSEKIIVLVTDRGDSNHGEISILDEPRKAERLVETLLEAGFEADRIKVFTGRSSEFEVNSRPVVALVDDGGQAESRTTAEIERPQEAPEEPAVEAADPVSDVKDETPETGEAEVPATAQMAAPVRFSSLFRSA